MVLASTQMNLCFDEQSRLIEFFLLGFCRAAALPRDYCGDCIQMRLSYSLFAPFLLYLIEWMDYSCTDTLPNYLGLLHVLIYKVGFICFLSLSFHFNLCIGVLFSPLFSL